MTTVMEPSPFPRTSSMTSCMITSELVDWRAACVGESETSFPKSQTVISCVADAFYPAHQRENPSKCVCYFSKYKRSGQAAESLFQAQSAVSKCS